MSYSTRGIVLAAGFVLGFPLNLWGEEICSIKMCKPEAEEGWCFRPVSEPENDKKKPDKDKVDNDKLLLFMRTNPVASLACFNEQAEGASMAIQTLRKFYGHIGGDVKPDNVDMVYNAKGDLNIGLIDLDDGGLGSLLVDVLHTLAYNQVWWKEKGSVDSVPLVAPIEALAAYQAGLKGEKLQNALTLKEILDNSPMDKKKASNGWCEGNDSKPKKIKPVSKGVAPKTVWNQYENDGNSLEKVLKEEFHMDIKDKGYERKEHSGGSMCAMRFNYLVSVQSEKPGKSRCEVVQLKHQPERPGPAALVFTAGPSDCEDRITSLIERYRPLTGKDKVERDKGNFIRVVRGASGACYIARYDRPELFKADKVKRHVQVDYTRRMLYWLGTVHAQQNPAYVDTFLKATADTPEGHKTVDELRMMVVSHIKYLKSLEKEKTFVCPD